MRGNQAKVRKSNLTSYVGAPFLLSGYQNVQFTGCG